MANSLPPLNSNTPIVEPQSGRPKLAFVTLINQLLSGSAASALGIAQAAQAAVTALTARSINTTAPLQGGGDLSANRTISLADTTVTPGTYGDATHYPEITVDQKGRITSASQATLPSAGSSVTVTDGTTSVAAVSKIKFTSGATVTNAGAGEVDVAVTGGSSGGAGISWNVTATGTGASQTIILPYANIPTFKVLLFSNGIRFNSNEYTIVGTVLTMTSNASGDLIEILGPIGDVPSDPYGVAGNTAAYGFRRLKTSYAGPLFLARRVSDGVQQQFFAASDGTFNPATLTAWSGASDVRLITWYDQSDHGFDITTLTTNEGALLVQGGTAQTINGLLCANFTGSTGYNVPFPLLDTEHYVFDVISFSGTNYKGLHNTPTTAENLTYGFKASSGQMELQRNGSADTGAGANISAGANHVCTWHGPVYSPGTYTIETFLDGASNGNPALGYSGTITGATTHRLGIPDNYTGKVGEMAFYKRALSTSERSTVENAMRTVWGI